MPIKTILSATMMLSATIIGSTAKNTNEDWKWASDYYTTYGEWTVGCDQRSDNDAIKRCYLRYVDAYAQNPFGALFVFITDTEDNGLTFNFEYESGVRFTAPWQVLGGEDAIWTFDQSQCPRGSECAINGKQASDLAQALSKDNAAMTFALRDRVFRSFELSWPSAGFAEALKDLQKQSDAREL
ncbi:MAG: hypothetical protein AAFR39_00790 [Pseudomonadota bacterium]